MSNDTYDSTEVIATAMFELMRDSLKWPPVDWEWCKKEMPTVASEMRIRARSAITSAGLGPISSVVPARGVDSIDLKFKNAFVGVEGG